MPSSSYQVAFLGHQVTGVLDDWKNTDYRDAAKRTPAAKSRVMSLLDARVCQQADVVVYILSQQQAEKDDYLTNLIKDIDKFKQGTPILLIGLAWSTTNTNLDVKWKDLPNKLHGRNIGFERIDSLPFAMNDNEKAERYAVAGIRALDAFIDSVESKRSADNAYKHPIPTTDSNARAYTKKTKPTPNANNHCASLDLRIINGFIAVLGAAAIALAVTALVVLSPATIGATGILACLLFGTLGPAALIGGVKGFFSTCKNTRQPDAPDDYDDSYKIS